MDTCSPLLSRRTVLGAAGAGMLMVFVPALSRRHRAGAGLSTSAELSLARFAPLVGTRFMIAVDGQPPVPLTLLEAEERRPHPSDRPGLTGESFSMIFGDGRTKAFDQGTHTVAHPRLGSLPLFVVPIGAGVRGQRYQVVVNQRVPAR